MIKILWNLIKRGPYTTLLAVLSFVGAALISMSTPVALATQVPVKLYFTYRSYWYGSIHSYTIINPGRPYLSFARYIL